jgi:hypothetical protein
MTMRGMQDIVDNRLHCLQLVRIEAEGHISEEALAMFDESIQDAPRRVHGEPDGDRDRSRCQRIR